MIDDQSILSYVGTWQAGLVETPDSIVNNVVSALAGDGLTSRTAPVITSSLGTAAFGGQFTVKLSLQVQNGLGFADKNDAIAIIRHEVLQETGKYPSSDSIPLVQVPGGSATPTDQPGANDASSSPAGCIAGSSNDLTGSFSISCWFSNLTSKGLSTVGLLALVAIAAIGLIIFYGPQRVRVES